MNVLLLQLDGTGPNLALMRLAAHHRGIGDSVELRRAFKVRAIGQQFGDAFDCVYASAIFERSRPIAAEVRRVYPQALLGGTGIDETVTLESAGICSNRGPVDYTDYPDINHSIGFTQRGCRYSCSFCKVPRAEGRPVHWQTIAEIWRGESHPRQILLLDNDFFGLKTWPDRIEELRAGRFRVSFNQGINVRAIGDEHAAALASVDYRDDSFTTKRLLGRLVKYGVRPDDIVVYMLIGYDHATKASRPFLIDDDFHRQRRLREFGCRPYPMPFIKTRELSGFQRWVVKRIDTLVPWTIGCLFSRELRDAPP